MKTQGGFNSKGRKNNPFQIRWREPLGIKGKPYAYRWVFIFFNYSIRIHHWLCSDDRRYCHNHPWWFITFILKGWYYDVTKDESGNLHKEKMSAGQIKYRPSSHSHYVEPKKNTWTILITGKPMRKWGFDVNGKFLRPLKYFHKYGQDICD